MQPVPEFFQSTSADSRLAQLEWLGKHLDLTNEFFAKVLEVEPTRIDRWRSGKEPVDRARQERAGQLWNMFLHLLSFSNFDRSRTRELLQATSQPSSTCAASGSRLPWAGESMRTFLERGGEQAIDEVNHWVTSFRFSDRYACTPRRREPPAGAKASAFHQPAVG